MSIVHDHAAIARRLRRQPEPEACSECEDNGWVLSSNQSAHPPNFVECPKCGNPKGHLSP